MEPTSSDDNNLKWSSIELMMTKFKSWILEKKMSHADLNDMIFNKPVFASIKYDGTNVGLDTDGVMYGRNKKIAAGTKSYQKAPLVGVGKIDASKVLEKICNLTEIKRESIETFVVYGELMCNNNLFNYSAEKIDGSYQLFGAVIQPKDSDALAEISEKLIKGNFAMRLATASGDDEENSSDDPTEENYSKIIAISMNQTYKDLLLELEYPVVPTAGKIGTLYDVVTGNFDWMLKGFGEGLILCAPAYGAATKVMKWKIGAEKNSMNAGQVHEILNKIEDDKSNAIFGENTEKAVEFFQKLEKICESPLVMGEVPVPVVKVKGPKPVAAKVEITDEVIEQYSEPVKSAKTKFDHSDTYYARNTNGLQEYACLIKMETLKDLGIDEKDKEAMVRHTAIIGALIKLEFTNYKKAQGGKKK